MTCEIVWADEALAAAQVFMVDDPAGLAAVFDTVDALAGNPRPPEASRWGGTDVLRLRTGRYRVLYEIDDQLIRIDVIHPGRSRSSPAARCLSGGVTRTGLSSLRVRLRRRVPSAPSSPWTEEWT